VSESVPALPAGVIRVREAPAPVGLPIHTHPSWPRRFPWLVQGTTGRGELEPFDLGLFGETAVGKALERWRLLRDELGFARAVHSLQVHGRRVLGHEDASPGLVVVEGFDGHFTDRPGVLLTVSVADCVPISVVDADRKRIALLHGGWRGTALGILAAGLERLGTSPDRLWVHLGPAICGACYEVGPEVHEALGLARPDQPAPVDVRAVQARQVVAAGVPAGHVSVSEHCTRCGAGFFSHRSGSPSRQLGLLGIRP
jgi:polyphenol oxidase